LAQPGEQQKQPKEKKEKKQEKQVEVKEEKKNENFRYIVRILNTDIDGNRTVIMGLQNVKGVGARVAGVVAKRIDVPATEKIGNLSEAKTDEIEKIMLAYPDYAPIWAVNRQADFETGEDQHLFGVELELSLKDDVNRMKMIRCYKGVRHEQGQKVRGQRTRSNGRTGLTMGVSRSKVQQAGAAAAAEEKK
jgi:small subunit ribosomal protein S13